MRSWEMKEKQSVIKGNLSKVLCSPYMQERIKQQEDNIKTDALLKNKIIKNMYTEVEYGRIVTNYLIET